MEGEREREREKEKNRWEYASKEGVKAEEYIYLAGTPKGSGVPFGKKSQSGERLLPSGREMSQIAWVVP